MKTVLAIVAATLLWETSAALVVTHYAAQAFGAGNFATIARALQ
jgi:hypothetical protein